MSAENDQSSRRTSPLYSATTSQLSTQTISSEEEYLEKDYLFPEEEEFLEEEEYLYEDDYLEEEILLKGKEYPCKDKYPKAEENLQGGRDVEEEFLFGKYMEDSEYLDKGDYLKGKEYLGQGIGGGPPKRQQLILRHAQGKKIKLETEPKLICKSCPRYQQEETLIPDQVLPPSGPRPQELRPRRREA